YRVPRSARTQQGAGVQRLSGVRLDGDRLVLIRRAAGAFRLDRGERHGVPGDPGRGRAFDMGLAGAPPEHGLRRASPLPLENLDAAARNRCVLACRHQAATACAADFASAGSTNCWKPTAMRFQPLMILIIRVSLT